jgi:ParB family chromosome partitioning protein
MSRVADRVGAGSFGGVRTPRSERGRAKAVAEGTIPDYELQRLPLSSVAPCPLNPRRNYGTDDQKAALGNSLAAKQTTACVAVTRSVYLALWPDHAELLQPTDAEYVLINGERRYRSALHVGLDTLDFVVRDDLAATQADFLDNLLLENEDREDFDVIERARGIQQLLDVCGGNAAEVARRRGKDRSWVGNQVALLTLPDEVQDRLANGELAERYGRRLARALKDNPDLAAEELLALADELKDEERVRREEDRALRALAKSGMLSADNIQPAPVAAASADAGMLSADNIQPAPVAEASADAEGGGTAVPPARSAVEDSPAVAPAEPPVVVLSADNTSGRSGGTRTPPAPPQRSSQQRPQGEPAADEARRRVLQLGATASDWADTLLTACTGEELALLLERLAGPAVDRTLVGAGVPVPPSPGKRALGPITVKESLPLLGPEWQLTGWENHQVRFVVLERGDESGGVVGWVEYGLADLEGWVAIVAGEVLADAAHPDRPLVHEDAATAAATVREAYQANQSAAVTSA